MRKLVMASVVAIILLAGSAFADDSWVNKTWCVEVAEVNYCLDFTLAPFGPGYQGDVSLTYMAKDAVFGPKETMDAGSFSQPDPEGNGPITLRGLGLKARITGETMMLYDDVLKLRAD